MSSSRSFRLLCERCCSLSRSSFRAVRRKPEVLIKARLFVWVTAYFRVQTLLWLQQEVKRAALHPQIALAGQKQAFLPHGACGDAA